MNLLIGNILLMNQPITHLQELSGVAIKSWISSKDSLCVQLRVLAKGTYCPYCRNYTEELHQTRPILVRDLPVSGKIVYLKLPRRQFYCRCCQRYITEQLQFIDWRRKYTQRYEENIYSLVNRSNIEQVSQQQHLGIKQVKNIFNYISQKRKKYNGVKLTYG